ncbi:MAG: thioredoxin domain-containing protein [Planctomycetes bacterium]|nr:thioredoxin domain-containing protein [Planctomycetota bacterium]
MTPSDSASHPGSHPASRPANRLIKEKSPYLLQHAHNPVDWYPWGAEAFEKARNEDKPIFLSIGYSTCHWCHVMERESFENNEIAAFMNEHFVCIKIDREERPDVDRVYMAYVQAVSGGGGWPMSVWLTPELEPFFGGTYYAPVSKFGRPGFLELLNGIDRAWKEKKSDLKKAAAGAVEMLKKESQIESSGGGGIDAAALEHGALAFARAYDEKLGGFGGAPKFPRPSSLQFLLRYHSRTGDSQALEMAAHTLRAMANGGMYDQLGGGFHRYSVDARWHVPHFEKMLYDQGQLAAAYADAYLISKDPAFERTLRGICDYVLRDLSAPEGGFYSAEDADSVPPESAGEAHPEKREGAFYVFTEKEIQQFAGDAAAAFSYRFGAETDGNAYDPHGELTGRNVLFIARDESEVARRLAISPADAIAKIQIARDRVLAERNKRPRPHLDDKILAAWNGLMISGLAKAAAALDEPRYARAAARAADFVMERLRDPKTGELRRRFRDGETALRGQCDDYADNIQGFLDLYQATFDPKWIDAARALAAAQDRIFYEPKNGLWYSSPEGDTTVLVRMIEDYDGAEPAPSSVAARNALRLAALTDDETLQKRAEGAIAAFAARITQIPEAVPQMLATAEWLFDKNAHVVIAGEPGDADTQALVRAARSRFLPSATILQIGAASRPWFEKNLPFAANLKPVGGKAAAYVCVHRACRLPVTTPEELLKLLEQK